MQTGTQGLSLPFDGPPYLPGLPQYFPGNIFGAALGLPPPPPSSPRCLVLLGSTEVTRPSNTLGPPTEVTGRQLCVTREMVNDAFARSLGQAGTRSTVYNASAGVSIDSVGTLGEAIYATAQALSRKSVPSSFHTRALSTLVLRVRVRIPAGWAYPGRRQRRILR